MNLKAESCTSMANMASAVCCTWLFESERHSSSGSSDTFSMSDEMTPGELDPRKQSAFLKSQHTHTFDNQIFDILFSDNTVARIYVESVHA